METDAVHRYQLYVNRQFTDPASDRWFDSFNPYTGLAWAQIAEGGPFVVRRAVNAAHTAFSTDPWSTLTATQRGALLRKFGDLVAREAQRLVEIEVRDNGKLLTEMRGQLDYIPQWFYYFGGLADKIEATVPPVDKKGFFNFTRHEALGVVGAITPWNSPLLLTAWKIALALAVGCTVVIKPSEFISASVLELVKLFDEAGYPPGVVNIVTGFGKDVGSALVAHPLVSKFTFTGSDATGRIINELAAKNLKQVNLELGGKSPNIVFADANLDDAINGAASTIFGSTVQTCIAGPRLLVQEKIHDEFVARLIALTKTAQMGDPMDAKTHSGPFTTRQQYAKVLSYIDITKQDGATLLTGGGAATQAACGNGWFIEPTIFSDVKNNMQIAQEEVFGPVLSVIKFKDEDDAVAIATTPVLAPVPLSGLLTWGVHSVCLHACTWAQFGSTPTGL
jgi:acyl-CoA reductase-like NAD-dependent aldehyde dehydrogenase